MKNRLSEFPDEIVSPKQFANKWTWICYRT